MKTLTILSTALALTALATLTGCGQANTKTANTDNVPEDYALDVCLVSGIKLGEHGKPHEVEIKGEQAFLCCDGCTEDLHAKADTYHGILKNAQSVAK